MKPVKQKMAALAIAVLLGILGTTMVNAGISIGFGGSGISVGLDAGGILLGFTPGIPGGTYVGTTSQRELDAEASIVESQSASLDEDAPSRPVQTSRRSDPVRRVPSQGKCDTSKKLAEIDSLVSRLKEVQADVKAGYQDVKAIAEFGGVVAKKLDDLAKCAASDERTKSAIAQRYNGVEKILSESLSQTTPKPKAGG